jgi:hypothetical protein
MYILHCYIHIEGRKLGFYMCNERKFHKENLVSLLDVNYLFISTLISKTIREKCCHTEPCKKEEC